MFKKLSLKDRYTKCSYCNFHGCIGCREKYGEYLGHCIWVIAYYWRRRNPYQLYLKVYNKLTALDYTKITDVEVDGIDTRDYPDFCDAFIASASYKGRPMTDAELERLNDDSDYVYNCVQEHLY